MIAALAATSRPAVYAANAQPHSPSRTDLLSEIQNSSYIKDPQTSLNLLQDLIAKVPVPASDLDAKAKQFAGDVEKTFAFVRDEIRYQAYEGVLRGPRGTLMAKAGNAFDKALLLGELLRRQQIETRFARATLPTDSAQALLRQMYAAHGKNSQFASDTTLPELPESLTRTFRATDELVTSHWHESFENVRNALQDAKVEVGNKDPVSADALTREASDHVWVEYKRNDKWKALDPTFADAKPGQTFTNARETLDSIPPELFHKVAVRVTVEERDEAGLRTREVMHSSLLSSDLNAAFVSFSFALSSANGKWSARPVLRIADKEMKGETFSGISSGMAGAAANLGASLFKKPGELPGRGSADISAVWLDFDFSYPSGKTETVRREIFDRIGAAARSDKKEAAAQLKPLPDSQGMPSVLTTPLSFSFCAGRFENTLPQTQLASKLPQIAEILRSRGSEQEQAEKMMPFVPALLSAAAQAFHIISQRYLFLSEHWHGDGDLLIYEASPRLAIVSLGPTGIDSGAQIPSLTIDTLRNRMRIVSIGVKSQEAISANIVRGIVDGTLEQVLCGDLATREDAANSVSTVAVFEESSAKHVAVKAVTKPSAVRDIRANKDAIARVIFAIKQRTVVVCPSSAVTLNSNPRLGWWQIELDSGETTAMIDTGLHQGTAEFLRQLGLTYLVMVHPLVCVVSLGYAFCLAFGPSEDRSDWLPTSIEKSSWSPENEKDNRGDCAFQAAYCVPRYDYGTHEPFAYGKNRHKHDDDSRK